LNKSIADQFLDLVEEGKGIKRNDLVIYSNEVTEWKNKCRSVIMAVYGKNSPEDKAFRRLDNIEGMVGVLETLAAKARECLSKGITPETQVVVNVSQTQINEIHNQLCLYVLLNIEHSNLLPKEKKEAKNILDEVTKEIRSPQTNWEKVKQLLKKSTRLRAKNKLPILLI